MIVHPNSGKVLHHNLVAVLLNDLYGIQARSGCACAGPYAQVTGTLYYFAFQHNGPHLFNTNVIRVDS